VIYETHVRSFTVHSSSGVKHPGTYRGLVEKIPWIKDLGVTAVELMPVQEFNGNRGTLAHSQTGKPLGDYWDIIPWFSLRRKLPTAVRRVGAAEARVQGNGAGLSPRGHRSDSGCRLQSHRRGQRTGPDPVFPRMDNPIFYTLAGDKRYYQDFTERATPLTRTTRWYATISSPLSVTGWSRCM